MRRKALIHHSTGATTSTPSKGAVFKALTGRLHYHSCIETDCRRTYGCGCQYPGVNGRCGPCINPAGPGRRRNQEADEARDPKACCVDNTRQVTSTVEHLRHQLAGPGPWFICKSCARTHGRPVTTLKENP